MVWMTPSTAATMPSAGMPSATSVMADDDLMLLVVVGLELLVHQRFHLVQIVRAQVTMRR